MSRRSESFQKGGVSGDMADDGYVRRSTISTTIAGTRTTANIAISYDPYTDNDGGDAGHPKHNCDERATCSNTAGSYKDKGREGWKADGFTGTDIDECAGGGHKSGPIYGECIEEEGSYA